MAQFLYNLLNSQSFWVVMAVWLFTCITWTERWKPVVERLRKIVIKPIIYKNDPSPDDIPFYPRKFMENIANGFKNTLREPFTDLIKVVTAWLTQLATLIYFKEYPYKTLGYVFIFVGFLFFVLSDAIAIANTLVVLELLPNSLPQILSRFDIAVVGGSLFALIICALLVFEILSDEGEFSEWSIRDRQTKSLALGIASLTIILSFVSIIGWSLFNLIKIGRLDSNPFLDGLLNWVLYGLVPINSALAAALTMLDGLRGFLVLNILIGWIAISILYVLNYLLTLLGSLLPYIFDVSYRLIYIAIDIIQWFISTPMQIVLLPLRPLSRISENRNFK